MNTEDFTRIYNESRNGANNMCRNLLYPKMIYSDGVQELADTGCYWLLDILGTEVEPLVRKADTMGIIKVVVADDKADIRLELADDQPPAWTRHISFTDMPPGEWMFFMVSEGDGSTLILPTEY